MQENVAVERLRSLKDRVNEVDGETLKALNERARIVQEITTIKAEAEVPIFDPKREEERDPAPGGRVQRGADLRLLHARHLQAHLHRGVDPAGHPGPPADEDAPGQG